MENNVHSCIDCAVTNCNLQDKAYPDFCLTTHMNEEVLADAMKLYEEDENRRSMIAAMVAGRLVWGAAAKIIYGAMGMDFTWEIFLAGAFLEAIPGIILHIVLIPVLVLALRRAKVME